MKIYIATSLDNMETHAKVKKLIEADGHTLTYDWTVHGSLQEHPKTWPMVAELERAGVITADLTIVLLPGARGTHAELGIALGVDSPVIIVGTEEQRLQNTHTCIFYHHANVKFVDDVDDLIEAVRMLAAFSEPIPEAGGGQ